MLRANSEIGPYTLIKQLGKGAFGVVWLAEKRTAIATSQVAIKIALDEEPDLEAIKQEASLWSQIGGHPNVLPMIEANIYDGQVVIVSEYAPDGSLESWLKINGGKAPTIEQAVNVTLGILSGLEHLHSKKVLHRDLKPANILLQGETPRLADFGLSRILKTTQQSTNASGTPAYMSPEAFDGKKVIQSDIWAAGVIFYQLLTGSSPFLARDYSALVGAIMLKDPKPLPENLKQFTPIITKALQKDPDERYKSTSLMKTDLQNALKNLSQPIAETKIEVVKPILKTITEPIKPSETVKSKVGQETLPKTELIRTFINHQTKPDIEIPKTPVKANNNAKFFAIAASIVVLIIISFLGITKFISNNASNNSTSTSTNKPITTTDNKSFEFETVKVDVSGKIVERTKKTAHQYIEDLGQGIKLEMVEIPAGTFIMGSPNSEAQRDNDEGPQHQVNIESFYLGKYEVTQSQYQAIMGNNPSNFKGDNLPVEQVSWNEAIEFCKKLSARTKKTYRLPSEAEWEYAARAGTTTPFAFGETVNTNIVNYDGNYPYGQAAKEEYREKTVVVGSLGVANAFGLYDLQGNVWEWCQDIYQSNYNGAPTNGEAWEKMTDDNYRVLRGGSWNGSGKDCSSTLRNFSVPDFLVFDLGFRIVLAQP